MVKNAAVAAYNSRFQMSKSDSEKRQISFKMPDCVVEGLVNHSDCSNR